MEIYDAKTIIDVVTIIIFCIGLPLTLWAVYALHSQVRNDHVAPIYVINLLISDFIQLCCWIVVLVPLRYPIITVIWMIFCFSALAVSVCFRVCIALERYLVIVHPLWYRYRRSIKSSVVVCVLVWTVPLAFLLPVIFLVNFTVTPLILGVFLSLPLPLFIFFLGGTLKALSASVSVPSDEKRRTVGILILLLLIYTLFFLPSVIVILVWRHLITFNMTFNYVFMILSFMLLKLSPLADLILYVFMRKGTIDTEGNKQVEI